MCSWYVMQIVGLSTVSLSGRAAPTIPEFRRKVQYLEFEEGQHKGIILGEWVCPQRLADDSGLCSQMNGRREVQMSPPRYKDSHRAMQWYTKAALPLPSWRIKGIPRESLPHRCRLHCVTQPCTGLQTPAWGRRPSLGRDRWRRGRDMLWQQHTRKFSKK